MMRRVESMLAGALLIVAVTSAACKGIEVAPTYVHGLAYPYHDPLVPDDGPEWPGADDWVAATFSCKTPVHMMVLKKYAEFYDQELTDEVWSPDIGVDDEDRRRYLITRMMVTGAEGTVYEAVDLNTGKLVAIKKVPNVFTHRRAAFKVWAEVKMLKLSRDSPDIMKLSRLVMGHDTAYIVLDILETQVPPGQDPRSGDILKPAGARTLQQRVFQYLRGVAFIHSARLVHQDLRWHNVMLDEACNVVIIDLGSLTPVQPEEDKEPLMTALPMRPYRHFRRDLWLAGATILSWIVGVDVHHLTQLRKQDTTLSKVQGIVSVFGLPSPEVLAMYSEDVQAAFEAARPLAEKAMNTTELFPSVDPQVFDLINEMMSLARHVKTAEELLEHPYLRELNAAEPMVAGPGDMSGVFEDALLATRNSERDARRLLMEEASNAFV